MAPDSLNVMYSVLEEKQPRRANLPMIAGSWRGTMISTGEGDGDKVMTETELGDAVAGVEVGGSEMLLLITVGYRIVGTRMLELGSAVVVLASMAAGAAAAEYTSI